jgi:hypothetical protein
LTACPAVASGKPGFSANLAENLPTRLGIAHVPAVTIEEDGTPMADLSKIGALEPDVGENSEPGWTEREEAPE